MTHISELFKRVWGERFSRAAVNSATVEAAVPGQISTDHVLVSAIGILLQRVQELESRVAWLNSHAQMNIPEDVRLP